MLTKTTCCGIFEYSELSTPEESLKNMLRHRFMHNKKSAYIFFSDTIRSGRGTELAQYILENSLGEIVEKTNGVNPNTMNQLGMWIFLPDDEKLKDWFAPFLAAQRKVYEEEVKWEKADRVSQYERNMQIQTNARRVRQFENEHRTLIKEHKERGVWLWAMGAAIIGLLWIIFSAL